MVLLPAVAIAVRIVPLRRLLVLIEALTASDRRQANPPDAARIAGLVEAAAVCSLPRPACLTKALVALALLNRRGLTVELVIGVTKARGPLEAHAWVRHGDDILVGGRVPSVYAPLVSIVDGRGLAGAAGRSGRVR